MLVKQLATQKEEFAPRSPDDLDLYDLDLQVLSAFYNMP